MEVTPDLCPKCGHDYSLDGRWKGFIHYVKGSDLAQGFMRPWCDEGFEAPPDPELEAIIDKLVTLCIEHAKIHAINHGGASH